MANDLLVKNVRPLGGNSIDVHVVDGRIHAVGAGLDVPQGTTEFDGGGQLLFPGFVDAHAHMDKTLIGTGWYRNEVGPTLIDKIENERRVRRETGIDSYEQSTRQARMSLAVGTTHIRTFVDIDTEIGLQGFEGVMQTREDFKDALSIEVVAFPQSGMLVRAGTVELMDEAMQNGAHVVGGLDPCAVDRDPARHLDVIFGLAEKYDTDVDIHLHEPGEMGAFSLELIAERTKVLGWQGRVVVSHAMCLGGVDHVHLGRLIDLLLENRITIMSTGPSGHRAAPDIKVLHEAGVELCTGNDGIRDSWGPLNMPDMLLRTFILAFRNNLRRDDEIEMALDVATYGGATVLGDESYGLVPGCAADFVIVPGETHVEAVIERPTSRLVVKHGRIVARDGECLV